MEMKIIRMAHNKHLPEYKTEGSSGMDLYAVGVIPCSHKHHLSFLLINSYEPMKGWIKLCADGCLEINAFF